MQRFDTTVLDFQRADPGSRADNHVALTLEAFFETHIAQIIVAVGKGRDLLTGRIDVGSSLGGSGLHPTQAQDSGRCH